jgi:hypothetical protein
VDLGKLGRHDQAAGLVQLLFSETGARLAQHAAHVVVLLDEQVVDDLDARPPVLDEACARSCRVLGFESVHCKVPAGWGSASVIWDE